MLRYVKPPAYDFVEANREPITVHSSRTINLGLGLPTVPKWPLIIAEIHSPILGYDFLSHHKLTIDTFPHHLLHTPTCTVVQGELHPDARPLTTVWPPPGISRFNTTDTSRDASLTWSFSSHLRLLGHLCALLEAPVSSS